MLWLFNIERLKLFHFYLLRHKTVLSVIWLAIVIMQEFFFYWLILALHVEFQCFGVHVFINLENLLH